MDNYAKLELGKVYDHTNGDKYKCIKELEGFNCMMERISDKWTLRANGTRMTEQGAIHWNYSTDGHWSNNY